MKFIKIFRVFYKQHLEETDKYDPLPLRNKRIGLHFDYVHLKVWQKETSTLKKRLDDKVPRRSESFRNPKIPVDSR